MAQNQGRVGTYAGKINRGVTRRTRAFITIGLLAVGMVSLQYVLEEGNRDDWFESRVITFLAVVVAWVLRGPPSSQADASAQGELGSAGDAPDRGAA